MRYDFKRKELKIKNVGTPVYRNPMFRQKTGKGKYIWLIFLIIIILGLGYLLFYSPLFKITKVEISGTKNISPEYLKEKYVDWQMQQSKFKIFKQDNILLFSKKWLTNNIAAKYALDELKIDKKLFHTLKINVKEKLPYLIWISNGRYYYIEANGLASAQVKENQLIPSLIKVYDEENKQVIINEEVIPKDKKGTSKAKFIVDLNDIIKNNNRFKIAKYLLPNRYQLNVLTEEGWQIYFTFSRDANEQVDSLNDVIDKKIKNTKNLQYIDLKVKDYVYYK